MQVDEAIENKELILAFDYIMNTNKSVFLTGKAGTGKTTFLRKLKRISPKRMAVVAPTGVAAINAGGVTIHSLFQLPFSPYIPAEFTGSSSSAVEIRKFSRDKISLIKSIDLLVIDEISMVRCDVLDAIDSVCRMFRDKWKPFGGIQLLLIGDIHQLSPVAKDEEWNMLKPYYKSVYFFSSVALQKEFPITIELKHIYRQSDQVFVDLLNKVRNNNLDTEAIQLLHSRYIPGFDMNAHSGYITLTTHNASAKRINQNKLDTLPTKPSFFNATKEGDFPDYIYPTEIELELKVGAQVMFIKNDVSAPKMFFNGKIGTITEIDGSDIYVKTDEFDRIKVEKELWENIKYSLDAESKNIHESVIGSFLQYPLKLAWAITIHKSQGLTFDKVIIDAEASFSSGQVYVALSRCKSIEGIVLISKIGYDSIKDDLNVSKFNKEVTNQNLTEEQLNQAKIYFQQDLLKELFDGKALKLAFDYMGRFIHENSPPIQSSLLEIFAKIKHQTETDLLTVFERFNVQLGSFLLGNQLPEDNEQLQERLTKASIYFIEKIKTITETLSKEFSISTDNKVLQTSFKKALNHVIYKLLEKEKSFYVCKTKFNPIEMIQAKANLAIDSDATIKKDTSGISSPKEVNHPELYKELVMLRNDLAAEFNMDVYRVMQIKTMIDIANVLPTKNLSLSKIKGVGNFVIDKFGLQILNLVQSYCSNHHITETDFIQNTTKSKKTPITKPVKEDTKNISFELYKEKKSVEEVAKIRGLVPSTIEGHLAHYVSLGLLPVSDFITKERLQLIAQTIENETDASLKELKEKSEQDISYSELKMYKSYMEFIKSKV
jgi:hypothetical protein